MRTTSPQSSPGWIRYEVRKMGDSHGYIVDKYTAFSIDEARGFVQSPDDVVVAIDNGVTRALTVLEEIDLRRG